MGRGIATALRRGIFGVAAAAALAGCTTGLSPQSYGWFGAPDPRDPWTPKISGWQSREARVERVESLRAPASVSGSAEGRASGRAKATPDLRGKYVRFRSERKRVLARQVADWIQDQARSHYIEDGPIDHWATLEETLARNGDDCDGLELLVYHALRDLGFDGDEIYRAIVYRPADGQHHMVTLWFEDREDPWVIDPTGAMVRGMPRMSDVPGWVPLKVFSEDREFTVRPASSERGVSLAAQSRRGRTPRR